MGKIKITNEEKTSVGWKFTVEVGSESQRNEYYVTLDKEYWQKLTGSKKDPSKLIEESFEFLLAKEPKESILKEFNLRIIPTYFPEYEKEIRKKK